MQFIDLKAQQNRIRKKIEKRIQTVLEHGKYIMGPEVFELEEKLAKEEAESILNALKASQKNLMKKKYKAKNHIKLEKDW